MDSLFQRTEATAMPQTGGMPALSKIVVELDQNWVVRVQQGPDHVRVFMHDPFVSAMYTGTPSPSVTRSSSILPALNGGCTSGAVLGLKVVVPGSNYTDGVIAEVGRVANRYSPGAGLLVRITVTAEGAVASAVAESAGAKYREGDIFTVKRSKNAAGGDVAKIEVTSTTRSVGQPGTTRVCGDIIRADRIFPALHGSIDEVVRSRQLECRCPGCTNSGCRSVLEEVYTVHSCLHGTVYVSVTRSGNCDHTVDSPPSRCAEKVVLLPHHKSSIRKAVTDGASPSVAYQDLKNADEHIGSEYLSDATDSTAVVNTMKNLRRVMRASKGPNGEPQPTDPVGSAMDLCCRLLEQGPTQPSARPYLLWCHPPDFTLPRSNPLSHANVVVIFSGSKFEEYLAESTKSYGTVMYGADAKVALVADDVYLVLLAVYVKAPINPLFPDVPCGSRCRFFGAALTTSETASFYSLTMTKVLAFRQCDSPLCDHPISLIDRGPGREAYLCRKLCVANRVSAALATAVIGAGVLAGVIALATGVTDPAAPPADASDVRAAWRLSNADVIVEQDLLGSAAAGVTHIGATSTGCGFHDAAAVIEKLDDLGFCAESMLAALLVVRRMRLATSWDMTRDMWASLRPGLEKGWTNLGESASKIQAALEYLRCTRYCRSHCAQMTATGKGRVNQLVIDKTGVDHRLPASSPATNNGLERGVEELIEFCNRKVISSFPDAISKLTGTTVSGEQYPPGQSLADKFLNADRMNSKPPGPTRKITNATKGGCAIVGLGFVEKLSDTVPGAPNNLLYVRGPADRTDLTVKVYPFGDDNFAQAGGAIFSVALDDLVAALRITDDLLFDNLTFPRKDGWVRVDTMKDWADSTDTTALLHKTSSIKSAALAHARGMTAPEALERLGEIMRRRAQQLPSENHDRLHAESWVELDNHAVGKYCAKKMTEWPLNREQRAIDFANGLNEAVGSSHVMALKAKLDKKKKEYDKELQKVRWQWRNTVDRKRPLATAGGFKAPKHINTDASHRGRTSTMAKRARKERATTDRGRGRGTVASPSQASGTVRVLDKDTISIS